MRIIVQLGLIGALILLRPNVVWAQGELPSELTESVAGIILDRGEMVGNEEGVVSLVSDSNSVRLTNGFTRFDPSTPDWDIRGAQATGAAKVGRHLTEFISPTCEARGLLKAELARRPKIALIAIGTNDVPWGRGKNPGFDAAYRCLVEAFLDQEVLPILHTLPPIWDGQHNLQEWGRFNEVIRGLAAQRRLPLIDLSEVPLEDGLHLSTMGPQSGKALRERATARVLLRLSGILQELKRSR